MPKRTSRGLTKAHLDGAVAVIQNDIKSFVKHFNDSQFEQNDRLDTIDTKLDAMMEMLATRKEMHNLVRELKVNGLKLDPSKIFVF